VPPATDVEPQVDLSTSEVIQKIEAVAARQKAEDETAPLTTDHPFPPSHYVED